MQLLLDSIGTSQETEKDWRHSKGSRSPSATNDSWRAPDSISGLENSGDSAGVREHQPRFWKDVTKLKRKSWIGAAPKGHGRQVRPTTAGGRQTPISGLKDSGNIAGVRDACPKIMKGVEKMKEKEKIW